MDAVDKDKIEELELYDYRQYQQVQDGHRIDMMFSDEDKNCWQ